MNPQSLTEPVWTPQGVMMPPEADEDYQVELDRLRVEARARLREAIEASR